MAAAEHLVSEAISQPATQQQFDALVSFACGIGKAAFQRSAVLRLLNDGLLAQVPLEILKWIKVRRGGAIVDSEALAARRQAEAELFSGSGGTAVVVPTSREVQEYAYQQNPLEQLSDSSRLSSGA